MTIGIRVGIAVGAFALAFPAWGAASVCPERLEAIGRQAMSDIRADLGAKPGQSVVAARAIAIAERETAALITERSRQVEEFTALAEETQACHRERGCLNRAWDKLRGLADRFRNLFVPRAHMAGAVMGNIMTGEARARRELLLEARSIAQKWVDQHYAELVAHGEPTPEAGALTLYLTKQLAGEIRGKGFSLWGVLKSVGSHLKNAVTAIFPVQIFFSGNSRAFNDWKKNVAIVISIQIAMNLASAAFDWVWSWWTGGPPVDIGMGFLQNAWIYINTLFMMTIQAEIGARNTPPENAHIEGYEDAMRALPAMLHGQSGYWAETRNRIGGFLALLPFELAVAVAAKAVAMAIGGEAPQLLELEKIKEIAIVTAASVGAFGSYLALRWSFWDKPVGINVGPAYVETTKKIAEVKLAELKAQKLVPQSWDVDEFYRRATEAYRFLQENRDAVLRRGMALGEPETPEGLAALLFNSPEDRSLVEAVRNARRARRFEWAWRWGICAIDSFLVFRLFGNWIPRWVGYPPPAPAGATPQ